MEVPAQFVDLPTLKDTVAPRASETITKIILQQDNIELKIIDGTRHEIIFALLNGPKC